jgi:uncharacterized protein YwqG
MLDAIRSQLSAAGLDRVAPGILELTRPAVSLATRRAAQTRQAVGSSRIGGTPDLPAATEWPSWNGRPLAFLAQLNLAELQPYTFCDVLPEAGVLQFFYDAEQDTWGFDPKDRGSFRVLFHPNGERLQPTVGGRAFKSCHVTTSERLTLPAWESYEFEQLGLTREEWDAYVDVSIDETDDGTPDHRVLGNPAQIQSDMQLECQLVSHGLYCGDGTAYQSAQAQSLAPGARDWRLLLQLDSDEAADMMWGDCGCLYFWITTAALRERRFDAAWMILQCT